MITWLRNLHIRLVGGSLLSRTVLSVAAFTMTTCLLLGLFSMAAVGATRAIVGGGETPSADDGAATVETADDDANAEAPAGNRPRSAKAPSTKARSASNRRPGGAVAPADVLRSASPARDGRGS